MTCTELTYRLDYDGDGRSRSRRGRFAEVGVIIIVGWGSDTPTHDLQLLLIIACCEDGQTLSAVANCNCLSSSCSL